MQLIANRETSTSIQTKTHKYPQFDIAKNGQSHLTARTNALTSFFERLPPCQTDTRAAAPSTFGAGVGITSSPLAGLFAGRSFVSPVGRLLLEEEGFSK